MADQEEAPPTLSKGQQIAYNVGVAVNLVDRVSNSVNTMATALEKVKNLFKPFETKAQQTFNVVGQSAQAAAGGGGGGFGGIAAIAMQFNAITAAASTIWNAVTPLMGLSSQAEQTTNVLAGTFTALGFSENITEGLDLASQAMARIRRESAALPGEASEYLAVFQAALPNVSGHFGNEVDRITAFTNQFAAVGRSFGIDAQQIGADLARMTQEGRGGAGMDVRTFTQMLPFINQYRRSMNQAAVTTETFNALTQDQRIDLLQSSFASLRPMIDRASQSWDAMTGSISANIKRIQIESFEPLFNSIKRATNVFNQWLDSSADGFVSVGRSISTYIAGGLDSAVAQWSRLTSAIDTSSLGKLFGNLSTGTSSLLTAMGQGRGGGTSAAQGAGVAASAALFGPLGALLSAGFMRFLQDTAAVNDTLMALSRSLNWIIAMAQPIGEAFGAITDLVGDALIGIIPGIASFFEMLSQGVANFLAVVAPIVTDIVDTLRPVFFSAAQAVGDMWRALGEFVNPALRAFGIVLLYTWQDIRGTVLPAVRWLGEALTSLFGVISRFLRSMGQALEAANAGQRGIGAVDDPITRALERLTSATTDGTAAQQQANRTAARTPPAQRGGNRTHNDFRNSRFDITQRFAEGFDPDRVAVAFTEQLEHAAAQRIDAGLNPLFTIPG